MSAHAEKVHAASRNRAECQDTGFLDLHHLSFKGDPGHHGPFERSDSADHIQTINETIRPFA